MSLRRATGRWKRAVDRILPAGPTSAVLVEKTGRPCRAIRPFARVPAARNPRRAHDETRCAGRLGCALSNLAVGARCIARPQGKQCWRIAADARAKKVKGGREPRTMVVSAKQALSSCRDPSHELGLRTAPAARGTCDPAPAATSPSLTPFSWAPRPPLARPRRRPPRGRVASRMPRRGYLHPPRKPCG